jgi:hypothetical protein
MLKPIQTSVRYLTFENFKQFPEINHFVSTRLGGVSQSPYQSLNIGLSTDDAQENVLLNRQLLAKSSQIPLSSLCFAQQVHGNRVVKLSLQDRGSGRQDTSSAISSCDAMISNLPDIYPVVMAADCVPILIYDPINKATGAIHSGWRGTVKKILLLTLKAMQTHYGTQPSEVWIGIGPCIKAEVFEVGDEVVQEVKKAFGTEEGYLMENPTTGRKHFDLIYANWQMLWQAGVPDEQIEVMPFCTFQNPDLCFSARRDGIKTGRFGATIGLRAY